ncbi:MAG: tetratricopeptide repeat protein [Deltaproteobacteria bacterium]|nr:tetratricopeptide repeat protein [Deltaproteobacteria bacterium]
MKRFGFLAVCLLAFPLACAHAPKKTAVKSQEQEKDPYFLVIQSNLDAYQGNLEASLRDLQKASEKYPKSAYLKYMMANRLAALQDFPKALVLVDESLLINSRLKEAKILKGRLLEVQGKSLEAEKIFQELVKQNPEEEELHFILARHYVEEKKYAKAVAILETYLKQKKESRDALLFLATIQASYQKNEEGALKTYRRLLQLEPDNVRVRFSMAQIYLKLEKKREALREYIAIEEREPKDLSVSLQIAFLYQELEETKKAIAKFNQILQVHPHADRIHYYLALLYEQEKNFDEALVAFERVSIESPLYKDARIHQAAIYYELNFKEKAIELLKESIRQQPEVPPYYQYLSWVYEMRQENAAAISTLRKGIQKNPKDENLLFTLAVLYDRIGNREAGLETMRKVLAVNPNNASVLNYVGYSMAEEGKNLEEAEKMIRKALELKPKDPYFIDSLGWVYFQKGDMEKALEYIGKSLKELPEEPAIIEHMGDIYLKKKNKRKALQYFRQSLKIGKEKLHEKEIRRVEEKIKQLEGA